MKWTVCFSALCITAALAGCAGPAKEKPPEAAPPASSEPSAPSGEEQKKAPLFYLNRLPELEPFEPIGEISSYYGDGPFDRLIPSEKYGTLYPYIGDEIGGAGGEWEKQILYGLCTAEGKVVVSPVYTSVRRCYLNDEKTEWVLVAYHRIESEDEMEVSRFTLAAADGSWIIPEAETMGMEIVGDGRIVINDWSYGERSGETQGWMASSVSIYDAKTGRPIKKDIPGYGEGYSEGLCFVRGKTINTENGSREEGYYLDKEGKAVLGPFCSAENFKNGIAVAGDMKTGKYGLIDKTGAWVLAPTYESLWGQDGKNEFFFAYERVNGRDRQRIIDREGTVLYEASDGYGTLLGNGTAFIEDEQGGRVEDLVTGETVFAFSKEDVSDHAYVSECGDGWFVIGTDNGESRLMHGDSRVDTPKFSYAHQITDGTGDFGGFLALMSFDEEYYRPTSFLFDQKREKICGTFENYYVNGMAGENTLLLYRSEVYDPETGALISPGSYALADLEGNILTKNTYTDIQYAGEGLYAVKTNLYGGLIDRKENWIVRFVVNSED